MKLYQVVADAPDAAGKVMLFVIAGTCQVALGIAAAHEAGRYRHPAVVGSAEAVDDFPPRIVAMRTLGADEAL